MIELSLHWPTLSNVINRKLRGQIIRNLSTLYYIKLNGSPSFIGSIYTANKIASNTRRARLEIHSRCSSKVPESSLLRETAFRSQMAQQPNFWCQSLRVRTGSRDE
jgi:hypothetical protein